MLLQRRRSTSYWEDKQGEEGEDIKKRETEFYSETLSFSHPSTPLKAYCAIKKIYISKP
jgi:hypothetical protein